MFHYISTSLWTSHPSRPLPTLHLCLFLITASHKKKTTGVNTKQKMERVMTSRIIYPGESGALGAEIGVAFGADIHYGVAHAILFLSKYQSVLDRYSQHWSKTNRARFRRKRLGSTGCDAKEPPFLILFVSCFVWSTTCFFSNEDFTKVSQETSYFKTDGTSKSRIRGSVTPPGSHQHRRKQR